MADIFEDVRILAEKASKYCMDCNPERGVLLCKAKGCVYKKLYRLLIDCLCLRDEKIEETKNGNRP